MRLVSLFLIIFFGVILSQNIEKILKEKTFVPCKTLVQKKKLQCNVQIFATKKLANKTVKLFNNLVKSRGLEQEKMQKLEKLIQKTLKLGKKAKMCVTKKKKLEKACPSLCKRKKIILDQYLLKLQKKQKSLSQNKNLKKDLVKIQITIKKIQLAKKKICKSASKRPKLGSKAGKLKNCKKLETAKKEIQNLYQKRKKLLTKRGETKESQLIRKQIITKLRETRRKFKNCFQ